MKKSKRLKFITSVTIMAFACSSFQQLKAQPDDVTVKYKKNQTVTYAEALNYYKLLDSKYPEAQLFTGGLTDIGKPLHLFVISSDGDFDPASIRKKGKAVLFINNAIHPGEPDGVDASIKLANDLLSGKIYDSLLRKVVICIIPVYNIDGALNRGCCSRANQDGPEEYGFRGNARNLDLNRDFIKADAKNTRSFISFYRKWDPDVFADTHVSDGADYQYTMTCIPTQHNKLHPIAGSYFKNKMIPAIYGGMKAKGTEVCPYVNTLGETPESGITGFMELPRFGSGYAALFNTFGFVVETHMLKPFPQRVEATYQMLMTLLEFTAANGSEIMKVRKEANLECSRQREFPLNWQLDTAVYEMLSFRGYEAKYKTSEVTGMKRLYYDRSMPFEKPVRFYDTYQVNKRADRPEYYVIPQAWTEVIDRFKWNRIKMTTFRADTTIEVQCYYITGYKSGDEPYEGRFLHRNVTYRKEKQQIQFHQGDYLVKVNQAANRFIVETLEPDAPDSYFAWGFFDAILQEKEWFSNYVFEEKAMEILQQQPGLKTELEEKKKNDPHFAEDSQAQLLFIYQHSVYYEKSHNRYPVYRIN